MQDDLEGDGLGDLCDPDDDNDGTDDLLDNCPTLANPLQTDFDNDLFGEVCDCDDDDGFVWSRPGQQTLVGTKLGLQADFDWSMAEPGGTQPLVYDFLVSSSAVDFLTATCLESDDSDLVAVDATAVAQGTILFYLGRAENSCGGSLGEGAGAERTGAACP